MQRLILLRHAQAVEWTPGGNDFARPLSEDGKQHAGAVAQWIIDQDVSLSCILCSPAQRTRETIAPLLQLDPDLDAAANFLPQLYGASSHTIGRLLDAAFAEHDNVLVVGHNPGLEIAVFDNLRGADREAVKRLPTGTLALFEFENGWNGPEGARLAHWIRGRDLVAQA